MTSCYTAQHVFWKTCLWYEYIPSTVPCTPSSENTAIWCIVDATDIVTVCSSSPPREYVILWVSTVDRDCLSGCCASNTNTGTHIQWLLKTNNIHWNPVTKQPQVAKLLITKVTIGNYLLFIHKATCPGHHMTTLTIVLEIYKSFSFPIYNFSGTHLIHLLSHKQVF